jgi:transcriptional regulator with XRE-family HTH domain
MTGAELKAIRRELGLSTRELGAAFGYRGNENTRAVAIRQYENGDRPIPPWIARLAEMFSRHGVPPAWTIVDSETSAR